MEKMINLKINGMDVSVPAGSTILEAARQVGIEIPTLCFMKEMNEIGACRICVVEVNEGRGFRIVASCVYPVTEGMEVKTNSVAVQQSRKMTLELLLSTHDRKCLSCVRSGNCEFQKLCNDYGIEVEDKFDGDKPVYEIDYSAPHMYRDNNKCILCRRCVAACAAQHVGVIGANDRGIDTNIACGFNKPLAEVGCVSCGQCIVNCPTGAIAEKDDTDKVFEAINDPEKIVVVQTAPAVRAALGEEFGMPIGTGVEGKMVAALRRLGFDKVFDTDVAADLTIMEEGTEFIDRVKNGGKLPMITSCSPGWIKFCEMYHPNMIENLSSCKSPQQMFGAVLKTYYAEKNGIDPKNIVSVSVMPCTAKKFEIGRDDQSAAGVADVDISITTRELARMIKRARIEFTKLPDEQFDSPLGEATGAGVIFGATGGVMEAALRTVAEVLEGKTIENVDYHAVRGTNAIKEATVNVAGMDVNICVVSGLDAVHEVLTAVENGEKNYHFIEVMCCPGGCVNGGGQPIQPTSVRQTVDIKALRAAALYSYDAGNTLRKSHESPVIKALYDEYFEKPGSHKAHKILHTSYVNRSKDVIK
ncbi:MAG: 2Fe-2S iron-sulfur cluster binding domain-containing protein [Ruminococcaceae bacterium]|nr:2Fe-2S iron-sulfur cluster binding domain-containing protein [Oscillospiraceae bacterium]